MTSRPVGSTETGCGVQFRRGAASERTRKWIELSTSGEGESGIERSEFNELGRRRSDFGKILKHLRAAISVSAR